MDTPKNYVLDKYHSLCNYLQKDTVGTELIIYGTSGLMLLIAYAKRKPAYLVRQFKKPSHIPDQIINERVMHTGQIRGVQQRDQDTLLLISHRPLIPLFTSRNRVLPVKLPGVRVNANGYSWLQNCIVGRQATFLPLTKSKKDDYVVSQLCLVHPPDNSKKPKTLLDVSETLLKLRFAKFTPDAEVKAEKKNLKYYKHLQNVEVNTLSRESWISWIARRPWLWKAVNDLRTSWLPKQKLLPELVR